MFYVIQENVFREENYNKIFDVMKRLKLSYEILKIDANGDIAKLMNKRKDVFVFGSVRAARLAASMEWEPGSFYGENHDFQIYKLFYKNNLLKWYMKGFNDELRGTSTVESDNRIDMVAYNLGAQHAIIGDDVSSIDNLSDEEIISMIEDIYNKNQK